uniref:Uncharacterized protein n=1 Tax=Chromera velia CCMP2878 TaxID=1169474 RepID=A0A0G4HM66_9ALVE|eukprot:Cvel_29031.t1-p1 / transcript=Cvel_29031.t1 / gene=Cvel_29031 / organism=Chromera_velia_CCMP2878 / gene_product=Potassium channel AKT1, putative / transcript_product=Potassium channel AKT1, putative / location=Cvel_scaffold3912:2196-2729(-) / protein_length=178 / sequence_SO=supercontig / SO=protein_coding / is_pseudo=false
MWHGLNDLAEVALSRGVEVDAEDGDGWTALRYMAARGRPDAMSFLISKGADVNRRDSLNDTPIKAVITDARLYCDGKKGGIPVLTAQERLEKVLPVLLENGAEFNAQGQVGYTALHTAVLLGAPKIVQLLKDRGADLQIQDARGDTPRDLARRIVEETEDGGGPWARMILDMLSDGDD